MRGVAYPAARAENFVLGHHSRALVKAHDSSILMPFALSAPNSLALRQVELVVGA